MKHSDKLFKYKLIVIGILFIIFFPMFIIGLNYSRTIEEEIKRQNRVFNKGKYLLNPFERDILKNNLFVFINTYAKNKGFSGAILVGKDDEIFYTNAFHYANIKKSVKNTIDTIFRIASLTKQFTGAAILLLEERGLLSVEDPISKYIPDYPYGEMILIRHLLTHTSGIRDYIYYPVIVRNHRNWTPQEIVNLFKNRPLLFPPGMRFKYSNSNYALLGYIIELVSKEKYEDFLYNNFFKVLNMTNTGFEYDENFIKNNSNKIALTDVRLYRSYNISAIYSAGALSTTVLDLYKWNRALKYNIFFKKETLKKYYTPYLNNYAFGVRTTSLFIKNKFRNVIYHGGRVSGFLSFYEYFTDEDLIIILLSNSYRLISLRNISFAIADYIINYYETEEKLSNPFEKLIFKEIYENNNNDFEN